MCSRAHVSDQIEREIRLLDVQSESTTATPEQKVACELLVSIARVLLRLIAPDYRNVMKLLMPLEEKLMVQQLLSLSVGLLKSFADTHSHIVLELNAFYQRVSIAVANTTCISTWQLHILWHVSLKLKHNITRLYPNISVL